MKNKQLQNGLYRAWYKGKQFYGKTDTEAKAKRDAYKYECEHGIEQQKPITVFDLADKWLPVAKAGISASTYNQYATIMEKMTDLIGNKLVSAVTPADINLVWTAYTGKSQSYISKASFLYKSFFAHAIENGYCNRNPVTAPSAKPGKGTKGSHRALEPWEIKLIETVPHRCQPAALCMLKAGLRRGEVLALRKDDIRNEKIYVHSAVKFVKNRPVIGQTKNYSSKREVPLFDPLSSTLGAVSDYVLPDVHGGICSETAFVRAWNSYMHVLSKAAGRKVNIRTHDLRHTFVTTCMDRGVNIRVCMRWCGHSSERMILEIYDHLNAKREAESLKLMQKTVKKQLKQKRKKAEVKENQPSQAI